ncbi:TPA: glycosyltransferase family 2 protein, partial [Streptococcus pneumoniae]
MNRGILVSIIVPIYNQEEYLNISLPTLKQQTYKNLEFILVDDGSTDSSKQIINEYLNADSRFKYVYKENGGLVSATIAGVKEASGDYLAFLDPDDKLGLDYIENFIKELDCDYDFIAAGFFYDDGKLIKPYYLKENSVLTQSDIKKLRTDFLSDTGGLAISNRVFISRWNKLYKTNLVKEIVKEFRKFEMVSLGEDTIFTFLLLQK